MPDEPSYPSPGWTTTRQPSRSGTASPPDRLQAALDYARSGLPVFPCMPGGKTPLIKDWPNKATTDEEQIREWWRRWPNANIGIPTGPRSGFLILDVDLDKSGFGSLEALTNEHGELPRTPKVKTGRGGMHIYFRYPAGEEIRNSAGLLGVGLDVRGAGGYVVAPPSATTGTYEWRERTPLSEAPEWLLEAHRRPSRRSGDPSEAGIGAENGPTGAYKQGMPFSEARVSVLSDSTGPSRVIGPGPIPYGQRNNTLTSSAGWLRARGYSGPEILAELIRINAAQCSPPIGEHPTDTDPRELEKIAQSASRYAPGTSSPATTPEVLEVLEALEVGIEAETWSGMGGKSERDVMISLSQIAKRRSSLIPAGARVEVDYRTLALAAGIGRSSAHRAVQRLRLKGWLRYDSAGRDPSDRTVLVLVNESARKAGQRNHRGAALGSGLSVPPCAHRYSAPRLRWSAPRWDRVGDELIRSTILRMGKSCGQCVDILEYSGGELVLDELYGLVYPEKRPTDRKRWRPRDLKRRVLSRLENAGVVEFRGDVVSLVPEWLDRLNEERENAGEIDAYRRDMARYEREREAYREHLAEKNGADRVAAEADGLISELEPVRACEDHPAEGLTPVQEVPDPGEALEVEEDTHNTSETACDGGAPGPLDRLRSIAPVQDDELTPAELEALEAIRNYELVRGPGAFHWDRSSCKKLFYSKEGRGCWPEPDELERIRSYVSRTLEVPA